MTRSEWMGRAGVCAILCAVIVPPAHALDIEFGSGVEAEYSTNVLRSETNEEDDLLGIVWGGVALTESSPMLNAQVAAVAEGRTYLNDTVTDDLLLSLASTIDWSILPERFIWHLEDYYQQIQVSPLERIGPDNRQDSNVFWTGPDFIMRLAKLYTVQLGGRFGDYYYQDSDGDNTRLAGSARLTRRLSEINEIYVNVEQMQVEFDNPGEVGFEGVPYTDFDRTDLYAGWAYSSVLTELRIELGTTWIERDELADVDGFLGAVSITRRLAREGAIGARIIHRYTEGSSDLLSSEGGRLSPERAESGVILDIGYEEFAEAYYDGRWGAADVSLRLFRRDEDYEVAMLDRVSYGTGVEVGFRPAPSWVAGVYAAYRDRDYDQLDRVDRDLTVGAGAGYLLTRHITAELDLRHDTRDSSSPGSDFDETAALISLRYGDRPAWSER